MEMSFARDIADFQMDILIILPRKQEDFVLLNITGLDGCGFLANKNQMTLVHLGRSNLDQYSNFPKQCPLGGNKLYYIRGYRWNMDLLPNFPIETDARIWFHYAANGTRFIDGYIECRLGLKINKKD